MSYLKSFLIGFVILGTMIGTFMISPVLGGILLLTPCFVIVCWVLGDLVREFARDFFDP